MWGLTKGPSQRLMRRNEVPRIVIRLQWNCVSLLLRPCAVQCPTARQVTSQVGVPFALCEQHCPWGSDAAASESSKSYAKFHSSTWTYRGTGKQQQSVEAEQAPCPMAFFI